MGQGYPASLEEKLPWEEPKGQKGYTFCQRRQGDFIIAYHQSHAEATTIEFELTWLNERLDLLYLLSDFWACSEKAIMLQSQIFWWPLGLDLVAAFFSFNKMGWDCHWIIHFQG